MGEARGWMWRVWAQAKRVSAKFSLSLPDSSQRLPYPLSQGLLPTQSQDRVLDHKYRRQSLRGPATVPDNLANWCQSISATYAEQCIFWNNEVFGELA